MKGVFILILWLTANVFAFGQFEGYDVERIASKAYEYLEKKDYNSAIEQFEKIHRSDRAYSTGQIEIVDILLKQEKYDEVHQLFKRLKQDGYFDDEPELYINYGSFLSGQEMYTEGLELYDEAEKKYPRYADIIFNKALTYYNSGNIQDAIVYTKKAVELNPGYATAHYFLGTIALESGQLSEGVLALLGFLAYNPNHQYAPSAVIALNKKMAQNYLEEKEYVFSEKGDKFDQLDLILRKQLPLNDKYKLNCEIDEVYTRHVQAILEYVAAHKVEDGFFEQLYIPFLADIHNNGQTEYFIYYTIAGVEGLEKEVKKQSKKVEKFYQGYFVPNFWNNFSVRNRLVAGQERDVVVYSQEGIPTMASEVHDGKQNGHGEFYDKYGRITGVVEFVDNNPHGLVTYFDDEGKKSEEVTYVNGIKEGPQIMYFDTGDKYSEWNNVNDVMDGEYITYFKDGSIYCKSIMSKGEYDQSSFCNYSSGKRQFELTYDKGNLNGVRTNYWRNGSLQSEESIKQNVYEGVSKQYDMDGNIRQEIMYSNDEISESYSQKDTDGNIDYEYIIDGKDLISKNYKRGVVEEILVVNKGDVKYMESYRNGEKYVKQIHKNGKVKEIIQFSKEDQKGSKVSLDDHKLYDAEGNIICDRKYKDGFLNGTSTYYFLNGRKSSQLNFVEGKETGVSKYFDLEGRLKTEYEMDNDTLNGYYVNYNDGVLESQYSYKDGKLNGPSYVFHDDGSISMNGFYVDDTPVGEFIYYKNDGKMFQKDIYEEGEIIMSNYYNKQGDLIFELDFENTNGQVTKHLSTNKEVIQYDIRNKNIEGMYTGVDASGDSLYSFTYKSGYRDGKSLYYSGSNEIYFEGNYRESLQHGLCKYYDDLGLLRVTSEFYEDAENGEEVRYARNGGVISKYNNVDDMIYGEREILNSKGKLLLTLDYVEGVPLRYKKVNDEGWTPLGLGEQSIEVKYANGNSGLLISFKNRSLDGRYAIFLEDGSPISEVNFNEGMLDGKMIYYYDSGKIYRSTNYVNDVFQGDVMYYNEDGSLKLKYSYKDDLIHGDYEIYENGQLKKTKTYSYNEIIEIK